MSSSTRLTDTYTIWEVWADGNKDSFKKFIDWDDVAHHVNYLMTFGVGTHIHVVGHLSTEYFGASAP